jgi:hypothetical protein
MPRLPRAQRSRALRVVLLVLSTLVAVPASLLIRDVFFQPKLDVRSIQLEASYQNPALLERAYQLPVAATYRRGLLFQSNGSLCGPTSVANVEHSLGHASASIASVLSGSGKCWGGVCWAGLSLDELADVARHATGRKVTLLRNLSLEGFREELRHVNDPARRYIVNFSRAPLFAQGGGHHSPIAAYLEPEDLVLVLDVNQKFKPWLVKSERLYGAIDTLDATHKRGLLRID